MPRWVYMRDQFCCTYLPSRENIPLQELHESSMRKCEFLHITDLNDANSTANQQSVRSHVGRYQWDQNRAQRDFHRQRGRRRRTQLHDVQRQFRSCLPVPSKTCGSQCISQDRKSSGRLEAFGEILSKYTRYHHPRISRPQLIIVSKS